MNKTATGVTVMGILACFLISCNLGSVSAEEVFTKPANLVQNPSFEIDADGNGLPDNWYLPQDCSWDKSVAHTGKHSLKYERKNPKSYTLVGQKIPLKPGIKYKTQTWVRTEGVTGSANFCVEWSDENGKYLGGHYPTACSSGTSDWTLLTSGSFLVPENAASAQVTLYISPGGTGTAWFDDVEVVKDEEIQSLHVSLLKPSYRGITEAQKALNAEFEITVNTKQYEIEPEKLSVKVEFEGTEIKRVKPKEGANPLSLSLPPFSEGVHIVNFSLLSNTGEVLAKEDVEINALGKEKFKEYLENFTYINAYKNLIVKGKPFFPIGIYCGVKGEGTEEKNLKRLSEAGFNTIICYGYGKLEPNPVAYMDRANTFGLKIIYSIQDFFDGTKPLEKNETELLRQYITLLKDHPALLGWYLNDEGGLRCIPKLETVYKLVKTLDPKHPTYQALNNPGEFREYFNTLDVIGPDPYPVPRSPLEQVSEYVDAATKGMRGAKPVWVISQAFAYQIYSGKEDERDPTYEEERCMTYLALTHGVKGVIYYSFPDLSRIDLTKNLNASPELFEKRFGNVKKLAGELSRLAPILLEGKEIPLKISLPSRLHAKILKYGDSVYVLLTNAGDTALNFEIPVPFEAKESKDFLQENKRGQLKGGTLTDKLLPLECVTYEVK